MRLLLVIILVFYQVTISYQLNSPSFISNWITITSPVSKDQEILHCLNELPVKVDVQIKVVKNEAEYIFTGTGTTQRHDDDLSLEHGGIVYVYDEQKVVLYPPTASQIGVAYSGSETDFNGPSAARGLYSTAMVRVRAWKASDFPAPLFNLTIPVSDDATGCFQQKSYYSAVKPDLVVAQVQLSDGMISEGQGNIFLSDTHRDEYGLKSTLSGVVFGYDNGQVKLWVPIQVSDQNHYNGAVFAYGDGFGICCERGGGISESTGTVFLKGYRLDKAFQTTFTHNTSFSGQNTITFNSSYSLDTALVMVQVREKLESGNNPGMTFNGAGSSMAGSFKYSGVVYVYNESSALLYTPSSSNTNGYMIYLGERWGDGKHPSSAKSADIIVTVFSGDSTTTSSTTYVECTTTSTDSGVTTIIETSTTTTKETSSTVPTASQGELTSTANTASTRDDGSSITTSVMSTDSTRITSDNEMTTTIEVSTSSTKASSTASQSKSTAIAGPDMTADATRMTTGATDDHISSTNPAGSRAIVFCPYDAVNLCECKVVQRLSNVEHHENDIHDHLYKIDKRKTSAYIRKHSSAYDGRFSAKVMGLTGSAVLVIVVLSIACLDMIRIKTIKKN